MLGSAKPLKSQAVIVILESSSPKLLAEFTHDGATKVEGSLDDINKSRSSLWPHLSFSFEKFDEAWRR